MGHLKKNDDSNIRLWADANYCVELWKNIFQVWQDCEVPSIRSKKFIIEKHYDGCPWFSIKENFQCFSTANPLKSTPYHLCVLLKNQDPEYVAAYKINAFLVYYHYSYPNTALAPALSLIMKKYNSKKNFFTFDIFNNEWIKVLDELDEYAKSECTANEKFVCS